MLAALPSLSVFCLVPVLSKSNHFYCHITTARVPWWVKFLRACSRQCRNNLHIESTYLHRRHSERCFLHILLFCTSYCFALFIPLHILLLFLFLPYICSCVVLLLYNSYFLFFCTVHWADLIWLHFTSDYTLYNLLCDKKRNLEWTMTMCRMHIHIVSTHSVLLYILAVINTHYTQNVHILHNVHLYTQWYAKNK